MSGVQKGLLVAFVHVAVISALGGKLLVDRKTRPRVWVRTIAYDPEAVIRGRYIKITPVVKMKRGDAPVYYTSVRLSVENDELVAAEAYGEDTGVRASRVSRRTGQPPSMYPWDKKPDTKKEEMDTVLEPIAFYIPPYVSDPSRRATGEELWVEVTLPKKGPPRPIQLGVKKNGVLTPLNIN